MKQGDETEGIILEPFGHFVVSISSYISVCSKECKARQTWPRHFVDIGKSFAAFFGQLSAF